ncbi:uncharacterized protein PgNI_04937 [Pyricularia grisea]|uniref:Uncharacterized protein n=1 Tax=Pyricularia grisea TaxID=148305 RepID=A0A6P8B8W0_PYRGI|nr:uncharacterized protein PgNI_04937 [Pyricularia grisea]TLD12263.1 hypothetical protein PgNI_04937 [Pyricularia grisea]
MAGKDMSTAFSTINKQPNEDFSPSLPQTPTNISPRGNAARSSLAYDSVECDEPAFDVLDPNLCSANPEDPSELANAALASSARRITSSSGSGPPPDGRMASSGMRAAGMCSFAVARGSLRETPALLCASRVCFFHASAEGSLVLTHSLREARTERRFCLGAVVVVVVVVVVGDLLLLLGGVGMIFDLRLLDDGRLGFGGVGVFNFIVALVKGVVVVVMIDGGAGRSLFRGEDQWWLLSSNK